MKVWIRVLKNRPLYFVCLSTFVIFSIDIMFMASGKWSDLLGFSFRKVSFVVIGAYSTWSWVSSGSIARKELQAVICLAIFLFFWGLCLPIFNGTKLSFALGDSLPLYGILFAPAISHVIFKNDIWDQSKRLIWGLAILLAIFHVIIAITGFLLEDQAWLVAMYINSVLDPIHETPQFGLDFTLETWRVTYGGTIFLFLGLYLGIARLRSSATLSTVLYLTLILAAIVLSGTRSFFVGGILFFFVYFWLRRFPLNFPLRTGFFLTMGALLLLITVPVVIMSDPSLIAQVGLSDRPLSDEHRYLQSASLQTLFSDNMLIGKGFGGHGDFISSEDVPYSYELSMFAYDMKVGVIGLIVTIVIFALYARTSRLTTFARVGKERFALWFSAVFSLVFMSNTNPYLFSFLGYFQIIFYYLELRSFYSTATFCTEPVQHEVR